RGVLLALVAVMLFSGIKVATIYSGYSAGTKVYDDVAESAIAKSTETERLVIDWDSLLAQNDDVVAWIRCPGTVINYPVVQGEDNEYYLEFLINGEWNAKGTPFVDAFCPAPFQDYLTIIYGHRMKDGSMFASLLNYFSEATYYEKYPTIELYTPAANYDMVIVGGAKVDSHDASVYSFGDFSPEQRQEYANMVMAANRIVGYTGEAQLDGTERLVLLSTCTPQSDDMRFVIWGMLTPME
ncbi:MAG: class B sortase, partial [Eubacterium sp.]|nr:class B sortase [Eubacterium sp.]